MSKSRNAGRKSFRHGLDPLPFIYALPLAAAMVFAAFRWGNEIKNMIHVIIKLVVKA